MNAKENVFQGEPFFVKFDLRQRLLLPIFKKIEIGRNGGRFGTTEVLVHKKSNFTTKASKETK